MAHEEILTLSENKTQPCTLVWLRRDLRLGDHAAIAVALEHQEPLQLAFIFDKTILSALPGAGQATPCEDRRVAFIHAAVAELDQRLSEAGAHLIVQHGDPSALIPELAQDLQAKRVVFAHDDEPDALARDHRVRQTLQGLGIEAVSVKDQCIFERSEVLTGAGNPFSVFTPYKNAWLKRLRDEDVAAKATGAERFASRNGVGDRLAKRLQPSAALKAALRKPMPTLSALGFSAGNLHDLKIPLGESGAQTLFKEFQPRIGQYKAARDYPGAKGPSYLSVHLRFGTISIRELVRFALSAQADRQAAEGAATWLSELIWRDFYMQILHHHPHVVNASFKPEYDAIRWTEGPEADALFDSWCAGQTGYPLVDAGMRQLNATGYMHNRLRMVVASFLTKDLGVDWRRGERYFAWKLNDYDLSANNGGWQWAASTGCDAQPYFRIFNPVSQSERFDERGSFIRRYVPEIAALDDRCIHAPWIAPPVVLKDAGITLGKTYPLPVVDHAQAREKTLMRFSVVKK
ncbi:MAG: deoxyribodipyrimidine photo-lyase [Burkholderiaceae bacterium]|nr:deoxyribodipyrimidine photo-lyase [Burkholderiaceae bacterium]